MSDFSTLGTDGFKMKITIENYVKDNDQRCAILFSCWTARGNFIVCLAHRQEVPCRDKQSDYTSHIYIELYYPARHTIGQ